MRQVIFFLSIVLIFAFACSAFAVDEFNIEISATPTDDNPLGFKGKDVNFLVQKTWTFFMTHPKYTFRVTGYQESGEKAGMADERALFIAEKLRDVTRAIDVEMQNGAYGLAGQRGVKIEAISPKMSRGAVEKISRRVAREEILKERWGWFGVQPELAVLAPGDGPAFGFGGGMIYGQLWKLQPYFAAYAEFSQPTTLIKAGLAVEAVDKKMSQNWHFKLMPEADYFNLTVDRQREGPQATYEGGSLGIGCKFNYRVFHRFALGMYLSGGGMYGHITGPLYVNSEGEPEENSPEDVGRGAFFGKFGFHLEF